MMLIIVTAVVEHLDYYCRPSTQSNMVKVEGVSQQWCNQFGTRVMDKLASCYSNYPDLSLDNFINKHAMSKATGPVSYTVIIAVPHY